MTRTIIQTTLSELPRAADYAGPWAEFYLKDITTLDHWHQGVPHLPHNRVWCGFNSFNIPSRDSDHAVLSLQGAGDLMILSQFLRDIGDIDFVTCYADRERILGKGIQTMPVTRSGPTEIWLGQLRHKHSYVTNAPIAMQFIQREARDSGWDHYDWMGLMLGIRPQEKWVHIDWCPAYGARPVSHPAIAVHLRASTEDRSLPSLWPYLNDSLPDANLLLITGKGTYHQTYRLLQQVDAVIAVDSVVLHMAVVARPDLPVLGVYTTTPTTWRGPDRPGVDRIQIDKANLKEVYLWTKRRLETRK
jgi:hypothetical protein